MSANDHKALAIGWLTVGAAGVLTAALLGWPVWITLYAIGLSSLHLVASSIVAALDRAADAKPELVFNNLRVESGDPEHGDH